MQSNLGHKPGKLRMDAFRTPYEVNNKHRILIRTRVQYDVHLSHEYSHLRNQHKRVNLQQRRECVTEVKAHTELA